MLTGLTTRGSLKAGRAVDAQIRMKPQDGSADVVVKLQVAPSYVTYNNRFAPQRLHSRCLCRAVSGSMG